MLLLLIAISVLGGTDGASPKQELAPKQLAATCFKTGERTSGMNKICYYDCLGSQAAITVGAAELCPLSIRN